jgi:FKBP-type peptidyl-prolyl cis-trans isomerase 2/glutaredoxin
MVKIVEGKKAEGHVEHSTHIHTAITPVKKKNMWIYIAIAVIVLAALSYFLFFNKPSITGQAGETLKIEYSMQLKDGTVIGNETKEFSEGSIASSLGISADNIDSAIASMNDGEEKEITLSASEAFGDYDKSKVQVINRTNQIKRHDEMNRTIDIPGSLFEQVFNETAVFNKTYSTPIDPLNYKVLSVDNNTDMVKLSREVAAGSIIPNSDIFGSGTKIIEVTLDKIKTEVQIADQTVDTPIGNMSAKVGDEYITFSLTPPLGKRIMIGNEEAKVVSFNETSIILDYNVEYSGQEIILKIKMLEKSKSASAAGYSTKDIAGAPTLDVFVMSYCPYGTQIEKALIPAWKLLKDKANIKVRFVSYVMHGDKETEENKIQLCLREETDQFWNYLECFLDKGDSAGCLNNVGVDSAKLNDCMINKADSYWNVDKDLNTKYGVQGSPTIILDGKNINVNRSPDAIKTAICDAFSSKPSECSQTLSNTASTAGFGYAAASSSTSESGGCGSA